MASVLPTTAGDDDGGDVRELSSAEAKGALRAGGLPTSILQQLNARFRLQGVLGEGGMGVVFRAYDPESKRPVALKIVHRERMSPTALERFRREGEITASLAHPGILRIHSAGEVEGMPYLAYELVEGSGTLDRAAGGLDMIQRVELIRDVARALGYAHAHGVTHRDVKPENILIDERGRPRLADFGLASEQGQGRLTRTGAMVGTPYYMAPEQFEGRREDVGPPTDVWALGVVLYQLLTQELPFDGETLGELRRNVQAATPQPLRSHVQEIPRELEAVCLKALCSDARERYPNGAALARDLDNWLGGRSVEADAWRRVRRLKAPATRAALLVGAALLVLAGTVGWFLGGGSGPAPDLAPPRIELDSFPRETWTKEVTFSGVAHDDASPWVEVQLAGATQRVVSGKRFALTVRVPYGDAKLTLRASDAAGNRAPRQTLLVTRERVPDWFAALPEGKRPPWPLPEAVRFGLRAGEYEHPVDGSVLVWVPPGTFRMGAPEGDGDAEANERPAHEVTISRGFFLGKLEVTWKQYLAFCRKTQRARRPKRQFESPDWEQHPVTQISFNDASDYCSWARLRLPTEAEWEWASRGEQSLRYPWGSEPPGDGRRCNLSGEQDRYPGTAPVGSFPAGASPVGAHDMIGNVWEWVQDRFAPYGSEPQTDPSGPRAGEEWIHRGAAWNSVAASARASQRAHAAPDYSHNGLGFRVALSVE